VAQSIHNRRNGLPIGQFPKSLPIGFLINSVAFFQLILNFERHWIDIPAASLLCGYLFLNIVRHSPARINGNLRTDQRMGLYGG